MPVPPNSQRGMLWMTLATGCFAVNDSLIKLAAENLPPYEVIAVRGVIAATFSMGLLIVSGQIRHLKSLKNPWLLLRGTIELGSVLCYIIALSHLPIATTVAIGQTAPLMLVIGLAVVWREKMEPARSALVALGFLGALLVAQPTSQDFSFYTLLAFASPVFVALRDLFSRKIPADMPVFAVAFVVTTIGAIGSGVAAMATENLVRPSTSQGLNLMVAAFFVTCAHMLIYMAYRAGDALSVAPFYYTFTVWAIIAGFVVFSTVPNWLALVGMGLIVTSGLAIVALDRRRVSIKVSSKV